LDRRRSAGRGLIDVVDSNQESNLPLSQELIFVMDGWDSFHGTSQVIVGMRKRRVIGIKRGCHQVLALEDGLDPKHLERYPQTNVSREFKPFPFDFCRLFAAQTLTNWVIA